MSRVIVVLLLAASSIACKAPSNDSRLATDSRLAASEQKIKELEARLSSLERQVDRKREAALNCIDQQYSRIESSNGTFFILCERAEPYLNGYRLNLLVGNPTTLTYHGVELHLSWTENPFMQIIDPTTVKRVDKSFAGTLRPGTWTLIQVTVEPVSAQELRNVQVGISSNTISLK